MRRRVCSSKAFKYGCKPFHSWLLPVLLHMVIILFAPLPQVLHKTLFSYALGSIASHADVLRGSSRVPTPLRLVRQERVTNP